VLFRVVQSAAERTRELHGLSGFELRCFRQVATTRTLNATQTKETSSPALADLGVANKKGKAK